MAQPGSLRARYEALAGGPEERRELFIVRAELGFDVDAWRALPWWQRRVYVEGLNERAQETRSSQDGGGGTDGGMDGFMSSLYPGGDLAGVAAHGYRAG